MGRKKIKKQKQSDATFQVEINADGACAGNPGLMGIGGVIRQNYPEEKTLVFSEPAGLGTNNEAEYLAVIKALETVLPLQPESVIVKSDSQLVIYQLTGAYRINYPHLAKLHGKVKSLVRQIPGRVEFAWVSREQNKQADALASKAAGIPQAVIRGDKVIAWHSDYVPDEQQIANLPMTKPECRRGLNKLLNLGEKARFRDFAELRTGGLDSYSKATLEQLAQYAAVRFGKDSVKWLEEAAGGFDSDYGRTALRWTARGLPPDMALKKVSVDMEIRANANHKKRNYL